MHRRLSPLLGATWRTLFGVSALCTGVVQAQEEQRIPRVPLANPSPTCYPEPECAGNGEPMLSYARTTGGVGGRTGEYSVTAFRLVLTQPSYITGFKGVGGDGNEPPDLEDFTPYVNVWTGLDAFAASPLRGDVYNNIPLRIHHSEDFGDNPADRYIHTIPFDPFFLDVGSYYVALHIDRLDGVFWYNHSTVDVGSDYLATSDLPGEYRTWESMGYEPGTVAIDVYGVVGVIPCPSDIDVSGAVDFADIIEVLDQWGQCPDHCPADIDGSGDVGTGDLQQVLSDWGPCEK